MFDLNRFEGRLEVAALRTYNTWAAKVESKVSASTRTAGKLMDAHLRSRDTIIATGIVSSIVTSIPLTRYNQLVNMTRGAGIAKPRLLLRTEAGFVHRLQNSSLAISKELQKTLRLRLLDPYDLTSESVEQAHNDIHQKSLTFFGYRTLVQPELDGLPRLFMPDAISQLAPADNAIQPPLTPDFLAAVAKEQQQY